MPKKRTEASGRPYRTAGVCLSIGAELPAKPARNPVRRTTGRVVGYYPSHKNDRNVAWESQLEQKACNVFEFSQLVVTYREQPLTVRITGSPFVSKYTPDFELTLITGERVFVEIKPAAKLMDTAIRNRLIAISEYFLESEQRLVIITDEELNYPDLQRNLKLLRTYIRISCAALEIECIKDWVKRQKSANLAALIQEFKSPSKIYALIAQSHLAADLFKPLTSDCQIFLPEDSRHEACFLSYRTAPDFERRALPDR